MADTIEFELVSPERLMKSEPVEMVVVPGVEGDIGVLPGHSPLICSVRAGVIDIHEGGSVKERIFIGGGFCEVSSDRCTVLAEEAIPTADIDREGADARLKEAQETLANADDDGRADAERRLGVAEQLKAAAEGTGAR